MLIRRDYRNQTFATLTHFALRMVLWWRLNVGFQRWYSPVSSLNGQKKLLSLHVTLCSRLIWITLWLLSYLCGTFHWQLVSTTIGSVPVLILLKLLIFRNLFNDLCVLASVDWFQYKLVATIIMLHWLPYYILSPRRGVRMFFLTRKINIIYRLKLLCAS